MTTPITTSVIQLVQQTESGLRTGSISIPAAHLSGTKPNRQEIAQQLAQELEQFRTLTLAPLHQRWSVARESPYVLALVGVSNVGKSTLLQALFEVDVVVKGNGPTTAFPTWYQHAATWRLDVDRRGAQISRQTFGSHAPLKRTLEDLTELANRAPSDVRWARVAGPIPLLSKGLVIVDTPGIGAALEGTAGECSSAPQLHQLLQDQIHQFYLCVAASDSWTIRPAEADLYRLLRESCGHVVVNKWRGSDQDQDNYRRAHSPHFPNATFLFANARRAVRKSAELEPTEDGAGVGELQEAIERARTPEERVHACRVALRLAWNDLHESVQVRLRLRQIPWNKLALAQLLHRVKGDPESAALIRSHLNGYSL